MSLLLLVGCSVTKNTSLNVPEMLTFQGVIQSKQRPIFGASVRLYATGTATNGSASTALFPQSFSTDQNGRFSISGMYTCPSPGSQAYVVATGGSFGVSAKSNPSLALMAALGPCGTLGSLPFAMVNESTTVGSVWPLAPYAKSGVKIGSDGTNEQAFETATETIGKLINLDDGSAPGPALLAGEVAPTAKLYTLATIIGNCAVSEGGTSGDGTPCGNLFSVVTSAEGHPPSDTLGAALAIAQNPYRNVLGLFNMIPSNGKFQPTLISPPSDWTLPILTAPAPPTILPATETVLPDQSISIAEATADAAIFYTVDGTQPTPKSQPYLGPITLTSSGTIKAFAIKNSLQSAVVSRVFQVLAPLSIALSPRNVILTAGQTQQFVPTAISNSTNDLTWSITPALGSISVSGLYTAQAQISNTQTVLVTATSATDPKTSATSHILLVAPNLPEAPAPKATLMSFSSPQGSSVVQKQAVIVNNPGSRPITWNATSNARWISFSLVEGRLAGRAGTSSTIIINPSGLGIGIHNAIVTIAKSDGVSQTIQVMLTVTSVITGYPLLPMERTFPSNTGMINVKTVFGAKGDGITDDTAALQAAISQTLRQQNGSILYFPSGVYLVSAPLVEKDLSGIWQSMLTLQGENQDKTIIKLTDNNPRYQTANSPTDVIDMGSLEPLNPKDGGGNNGFDNYIYDITIDVGSGNPGAVALDFMGNNYCGLRNVTLSSSDVDHVGAVGLRLLRYATGPCLMKNLVISGFDYGISAANLEYSTTFEGLTLLNQKSSGIYNAGDVLSIRGLTSNNRVPAIINQSPYGLVTLLQATLQEGLLGSSAILNQGTLYARNVRATGYGSAITNKATMVPGLTVGEYSSGPVRSLFSKSASSLNLPIQETPQFEDSDLSHWKSVVSCGADPTGRSDSSNAVQTAIDSGATTVYFPMGQYLISKTIVLRGNIRMIQGFDSWIEPIGNAFQDIAQPTVLFQVNSSVPDVTISHLRVGNWQNSYPGLIVVQQNSHRSLALLNSTLSGSSIVSGYENTTAGDGTTFMEDFSTSGPIKLTHSGTVFARQLNPEMTSTKIMNNGSHLWILGLKTEQAGTTIETDDDGFTELIGGLIYPVQNVPVNQSNFVVRDSSVSLIYAVSNYTMPRSTSYPNFQSQVLEVQNGIVRSLTTSSAPTRGYGVVIPLYTP